MDISSVLALFCTCCSLIFRSPLFSLSAFFSLNTIWHSFLASRCDITCRQFASSSATWSDVSLKQQKGTEESKGGGGRRRREERMRRTGGWAAERYLRQSSTFFVICSTWGRKASYLLYYHRALISTALTTHLCTKASWYLKDGVFVCVRERGRESKPKKHRGISFPFTFSWDNSGVILSAPAHLSTMELNSVWMVVFSAPENK